MTTWNQRMREEEERVTRLKEEALRKQKELQRNRDEESRLHRLQREAAATEKLKLFDRLRIVDELETINRSEVWKNLGEVKVSDIPPISSRRAVLQSAYSIYSLEHKTRKGFGSYTTLRPSWGVHEGLQSSGTIEHHLGLHDVSFHGPVKERHEQTSVSVTLSYKTDTYELVVRDGDVKLSSEYVSDFDQPEFGLRVTENTRYFRHPDYSYLEQVDSRLCLIFPVAKFDEGRVRDFLIKALTASCFARTKEGKLPSDFQEKARQDLRRLQPMVGKRWRI